MRNIDDIGSTNGLVYEEDTYAVIGAATDVYYRLGCSFLEPGIHRIHGIITEI